MTISAYLFVGDPARSGTTAFTKLINSHPQIALGDRAIQIAAAGAASEIEEIEFASEQRAQVVW